MFDDLSESDEEDEAVLGALDGRGMPIGEAAANLMGGTSKYAKSEAGDGMELDAEDDDRNKSAAQVRNEATAFRARRQDDGKYSKANAVPQNVVW
jgi:hypothetical protein